MSQTAGFESTYKELKLYFLPRLPVPYENGFESTYKELKPAMWTKINGQVKSFESTYKELKQG